MVDTETRRTVVAAATAVTVATAATSAGPAGPAGGGGGPSGGGGGGGPGVTPVAVKVKRVVLEEGLGERRHHEKHNQINSRSHPAHG